MKKKKKSLKKWWRVVVRVGAYRKVEGTNRALDRVVGNTITFDVVSKNIHSAIQKVYDKKVLTSEDWIERCDYLGQPTL